MAVDLKCQETRFSDTPKKRNATYPRNLNMLQTYLPKILCLGVSSTPDLAQNWGSSLSLKYSSLQDYYKSELSFSKMISWQKTKFESSLNQKVLSYGKTENHV